MENGDLLRTMMQLAVPLHIMRLREKGGPTAEDYAKTQHISYVLGEHGDVLLYGGGKPGEAAHQFNGTAHAIAVLSFCPGGVDAFGCHFDANPPAPDPDKDDPRIVEDDEREEAMNRGPYGAGA